MNGYDVISCCGARASTSILTILASSAAHYEKIIDVGLGAVPDEINLTNYPVSKCIMRENELALTKLKNELQPP